MRELACFEIKAVSAAGLYCIDNMEDLKKIIWQAATDGVMIGVLFSSIIGVTTYSAATYVMEWQAAVEVGAIIGSVAFFPLAIVGIKHSSAWNIFE